MGNKIVEWKIPVGTEDSQWKEDLIRKIKLPGATVTILRKSLDARKKKSIQWQMRLLITSEHLKESQWIKEENHQLDRELLSFRDREKPGQKKVLVVGSGPGGLFPALALNRAGYSVKWIEQGLPLEERRAAIGALHHQGILNEAGNYSVGEGGAGTFSDGKLTSRSKGISKEKEFMLQQYLRAGAPEEISYLSHPHLGSDNLYHMTLALRKRLEQEGVETVFQTRLEDLVIEKGKVQKAIMNGREESFDQVIVAPGHSHYPTYRMLLHRGIPFRPKIFALGFRAEHSQGLINRAQWGCESLPGVKAAEYRLSDRGQGTHRVYSFCMCPGGQVVPASPSMDLNIVNGMSLYSRNSPFANAAVVCSFHPSEYLGEDPAPAGILDWLEEKEQFFKQLTGDFRAPACTIRGFINERFDSIDNNSSYPLGLMESPLWRHLPGNIIKALQQGLISFSRKIKGYDQGILLGLESKSSAPIQVIRSSKGSVDGVENLYITGEGSGWAGGIISSGADGLRTLVSLWN